MQNRTWHNMFCAMYMYILSLIHQFHGVSPCSSVCQQVCPVFSSVTSCTAISLRLSEYLIFLHSFCVQKITNSHTICSSIMLNSDHKVACISFTWSYFFFLLMSGDLLCLCHLGYGVVSRCHQVQRHWQVCMSLCLCYENEIWSNIGFIQTVIHRHKKLI